MNAVVAHGGGPTSVINASLAGLVASCREHNKQFRALYGARFGVRGLLSQQWTDLLTEDAGLIERVGCSPGSALGSSRQKLSEDDYPRILEILDRNNIHCFFYTGGNGSMDTALRVARFARNAGYALQVIGIPKTIDNDLCITDHTPGYASTAHFFAIAARDIGEDNRALPSPVCVLEVLGRNAGWVVAATALARKRDEDAPHLIYFPEKPVSLDRIAGDVERVYSRLGRAVIAICEGQLDETGKAFGADVDRAGSSVHKLASNVGHTLARLIAQKLNLRARAEKPGLFGRSCGPLSTRLDREEARVCGSAAAEAAAQGHSNAMIALRRESDAPYRSSTFLVPLEEVARAERLLPLDWIAPEDNDVTPKFLNYISPLIPDIEGYAHL
ncbi:MAG: diphosphate--fructose-6-phosphate 1-phosphotransferase [Acidobacteriaceae bacterium]|nr:diphosphate--fructose-6-phosphate 1-phosphotransferase [Acidobacteriaceae bacterium]